MDRDTARVICDGGDIIARREASEILAAESELEFEEEECPEHGPQMVMSDHRAYPTWDRESGVQLLIMHLDCGCWMVAE